MSVLVTGGAGFIGSHLVDHLLVETEEQITILDDFSTGSKSNTAHYDMDRIEMVQGDVRDKSVVENLVANVDSVYHLAAAVGVKNVVENPLKSLQTNLSGTENVLSAAAEHHVPTFIASSSEVYGKSESLPFYEEDNRVYGPTTSPRWGYATAKAADEFFALGYHEKHDLPVVVGRYFNIVGPRQTGQYGMVIPTFVKQALNGEDLTVYGDGTQTRSFTHVHDAVSITHELLTTSEAHGEIVNIGAPNPISINDLAARVIELTESTSDIAHIPFDEVYDEDFEEPDEREPDISKLQTVLGRSPTTDLDRILRDVIEEQNEQVNTE